MHDELGNRMKEQYEHRTRYFLPRRTYTVIRVDGKAFHTLTKDCKKPFDKDLMRAMDETAKYMCSQIQGARLAYVQSDEISIILTDFENLHTDAWFDGNIQKIASVSASLATAYFNTQEFYKPKGLACFDARVYTIPDYEEVLNYLVWRQQDATRNSLQMAARAVYSHKQCDNKNTSEMQEMLFQGGVNWNDYTSGEKRGRLIVKEYYYVDSNKHDGGERGRWVILDGSSTETETPIFTQDREFLKRRIPRL